MRMNMLLSFVGGSGRKGEESPSIFILTLSTLIIFLKAFCFVNWIPWRWPLRCPFCCLIQVWHVFVDELNGKLGPRCIVFVANGPDDGFFYREFGCHVVPEEILACALEVKNDVYGFIV
jgi:hypothetical protein